MNEKPVYKNPDAPIEKRARDLVSRMTLQEKISQTVYNSPEIERLDIPEYNWWNEGLHGVARAGVATVFPQAIGLAGAFNPELMFQVATAISDEARAKHHEFARKNDRGIYKGLTYWSPNINIFRDPRWGRGQETYGEDPYLTGRLGVSFVKGLQGDNSDYLKVVATPKHFAVHSGPEPLRHGFDAIIDEKTMRETYLPAFKECVQEGGAWSIMGAYNRTNGEACCASITLLQKLLREEWDFQGFVVSDCGAISDIHLHHKLTESAAESAALAVKNGCDLNCGKTYDALIEAAEKGLISEKDIDVAVERLMMARLKLGMFDSPDRVPFTSIPFEIVGCDVHRELALKAARESMVLLKNEGNVLPLNKDMRTIAVIGPNADSRDVLIGNYYGTPNGQVTALEGIRSKLAGRTRVSYAEGCHLYNLGADHWHDETQRGFAEAVSVAEHADAVVICLGLSPDLEGEEGDVAASDGGGDRAGLDLPGDQLNLLKKITEVGKPTVLVVFSGSPVDVGWAQINVNSIIEAWYPGEAGGTALADILFGDHNPGGRLPITFPLSVDQLPDFTDYSMKNRTYRYMTSEPLYPFGFGLSYTSFEYTNLVLNASSVDAGSDVHVSVDVRNTGKISGSEAVQMYLSDLEASTDVPIRQMIGLRKIFLNPGEKQTVPMVVGARQMALIKDDGGCFLEPGTFSLSIGGCQPDQISLRLASGCTSVLSSEFEVTGDELEMEY
ncbi:MAG: glycoside hydrolase family 3 protein [Spirochaetales bacterium]|jgi:beta-glucosidase|nr:glycoside hydrolase family 3 protein [Spirochaetales bacterium]